MNSNRGLPAAARILFWLALNFAMVMALLPAPPQVLADDKSQHMLAFAVLTLLMGIGWPRLALWRIVAIMALVGAGIEVAQAAFPALHREGDIFDWYADMAAVLGVAITLGAIRAGLRRRGTNAAD